MAWRLLWRAAAIAACVSSELHLERCTEEDHQSLLQAKVGFSDSSQLEMQSVDKMQVREAAQEFHDAVEMVQDAQQSTSAVMSDETKAARLLNVAAREAQQAEQIQQAHIYEEQNVTQVLHAAALYVRQLQESVQSPELLGLLQAMQHAEVAQAEMISDSAQEDRALTAMRSALVGAVHAVKNAKSVAETETSSVLQRLLDQVNAMAKTSEESRSRIEQEMKDAVEEEHKRTASAVDAEHRQAEQAKREVQMMLQAASSTQRAYQMQAVQTSQSLLKLSAEASEAARRSQSTMAAAPVSPLDAYNFPPAVTPALEYGMNNAMGLR